MSTGRTDEFRKDAVRCLPMLLIIIHYVISAYATRQTLT